jgi:N-acetylmuramate 1-kinase
VSRESQIKAFLARHGYGAACAEPMAPDASFRRYFRVGGGPRPAILMDAPPPEDVQSFLRIGNHLRSIGISVPEVFAADTDLGLLLEEDLGDGLMSRGSCILSEPVVDALVVMQRAAAPPSLPFWDATSMTTAALGTLFDWWWPAMFGSSAPAQARNEFASALATMLEPLSSGPTCFVHRDFFVENLFWLPQRCGIRRVGIIDFQGGAIGSPAYDLVSLLQDARRDIPEEVEKSSIATYLARRRELDPVEFHAAYAACAAQRHLRVACQWIRLARRDNRKQYLVHGARTWRLLNRAVQEPVAAPLRAALDRWIRPERRCNPP